MDDFNFFLTYRTFKSNGDILSPEQVSNLLEDKNLSVIQLNQVEQLYNKNYTSVFNYLKSLTQLSEIKIE
tara:strand:- start:1690 stop:1899 length:210 start_codon:yes stop_codon:yes gene_type:complete